MKISREKRHQRIRKKVKGTQERPRLSIYRSLNNIYAQLIDDENDKTLLTCSSLQKDLKGQAKSGNKKASALVGELIAKKAKEKGIEKIVFDRGGYLYHGCVKAVAEAARKAGLVF
ncbi:MAG: 50S ribosomal protein L18 [Candidatus Omnitrophica bacterium]|nr:50S ribosomal protein L18 [Candidatus Omnitrophota bacterium]